jgi:hypothetical protein
VFLDETHVAALHRQRLAACVAQRVRVSVLDAGAVGSSLLKLVEAIACHRAVAL